MSPTHGQHDEPSRTPSWRRYLRFWGAHVAEDVDDELRFHYEMRLRDYMARGMSADDARRTTLARLGDVGTVRDECLTIGERRTRHMARTEWIDAFTQDWRFALRTLGRQRSWTAIAVLTLALGIGATTAVYSVVDTLILHPIDYPNANRIVLISRTTSSANTTGIDVRISLDPPVLEAWRSATHTVEDLEGYTSTDLLMDMQSGPPREVHASRITSGFPAMAGRTAIIGRMFNESDVGAHVAMLGEGMWRQRFGADRGVLGKAVRLNDSLYTVIGVLPSTLRVPEASGPSPDVWLPIDLSQAGAGFFGIARLRRGVSPEQAKRELDPISARADTAAAGQKFVTLIAPPSAAHGKFRDSLWMLLDAVALVLLIACANVAHLLLARTASRQRELSIRAALGAGTGRLFRQLLTESAMLAAAAALIGVFIAWALLHLLVSAPPQALAQLTNAHLDGNALALTTGVCVLVALLFGLIGARQARGHSASDSLRSTTTSGSRRDSRLRAVLVVTEMIFSAMLLVGAGLLVRSVAHLQRLDPGFNPSNLYSVRVTLPPSHDTTGADQRAFFTAAAARIRTLAGVEAVTLSSAPPTWFEFMIGGLQAEGQPDPPAGTTAFINSNSVSPDYFRVMGVRMLEGHTFIDTAASQTNVVVNSGLAKRLWPGQSAIGKRLRIVYAGKGNWKTVVGVADNTLSGGLTADATKPIIYSPLSTSANVSYFQPTLMIRMKPGGASPLPGIRGIITSLNPRLAPPDIQNVQDTMAGTIALPRFTMLVLTSLTLLAVLLAAIGLYGVLAYAVTQRSREIGIRVALGAPQSRIARLVVTQALILAAIGAAIGLLAAHRAAKLIASMLYGVTTNDPWSFAIGGAALIATAVIASLVPTWRALRVDPLTAIRSE